MVQDRFKTQCPNLLRLLEVVWTITFSNAEAERMVHVANAYRNRKRGRMSMVLLNSFMAIAMNGLPLSECDPLIEMAVDYWYKIGGGSVASNYSAKDVVNCDRVIAEYYQAAGQAGTEYARRTERRQEKFEQNKCIWE